MRRKVGDAVQVEILGKRRTGRVVRVHKLKDMADVDFGNGDVFGITWDRMKSASSSAADRAVGDSQEESEMETSKKKTVTEAAGGQQYLAKFNRVLASVESGILHNTLDAGMAGAGESGRSREVMSGGHAASRVGLEKA